jgi:hypothetical protein
MARAEDMEDFGHLNSAQPEAEVNPVVAEAEVDPAPPPETGEGSLAAPASTVSGGGSSPEGGDGAGSGGSHGDGWVFAGGLVGVG